VSVRLSITNLETLVASAVRRALRHGESEAIPRISDLDALAASTAGKVEIDALEEGRDAVVLDKIVKGATLEVFRRRVPTERFGRVVGAFEDERVVHAGDDLPSADYVALLDQIDGLREIVESLAEGESSGEVAAAVELVLEGLHLSKRLNKDTTGSRSTYRGRV
jgi:magnesium chelatase subunit I